MARFTQYPNASAGDYANATTFLIANEDGEIKQASLEGLRSNFGCDIQCASLTIASADILTGNSSPVAFGLNVPIGYAVEALSGIVKINYGTTPYATNMTVAIRTVGATDSQLVSLDALNASLSCSRKIIPNANFTATDTQLINAADLEFYVPTGNPTAGDSDIELFALYRLIQL